MVKEVLENQNMQYLLKSQENSEKNSQGSKTPNQLRQDKRISVALNK